jgi:hypothetical protein
MQNQELKMNIHDILNECKKAGYKIIHIGYGSNHVPHSMEWPNPPFSIWGNPKILKNKWPAIWEVVRKFPEISGGAGNSGQYQLNHGCFESQTWKLIKNKWKQIE